MKRREPPPPAHCKGGGLGGEGTPTCYDLEWGGPKEEDEKPHPTPPLGIGMWTAAVAPSKGPQRHRQEPVPTPMPRSPNLNPL